MLYPIGIQNFCDLRTSGYVYVDKTAHIRHLVSTGKYYFLSRPRRFGKSLLMSTMEAYFEGRKELFEGLDIAEHEKEWTEYPVLHLDLSGTSYRSEQIFDEKLSSVLDRWENRYHVSSRYRTESIRFQSVIEAAYAATGRQVVVLIDEYDKPIVDNIGNTALQSVLRDRLQGFYSVLKTLDGKIRFGFLTGVTKIGKMSVFSGLNNLNDISMDASSWDICGITEAELDRYFGEGVSGMADALGMTAGECRSQLRTMYDGYHFCEDTPGVYNPFSLITSLSKKKMGYYWAETGTPAFLIQALKADNISLQGLTTDRLPSGVLTGVSADGISPIAMLYQSGYLTIRSYDSRYGTYTLDYPNREVENAFTESLSQVYTPRQNEDSAFHIQKFAEDIERGDADMFMNRLSAFFADNDYQVQGKAELYFQNTMYILLKLLGNYVEVERHTSNGRIDILLQTSRYVYVIEIKRDKDPSDALDQIDTKAYCLPFQADGRKVIRIGVTFSTASRRIEGWEVQ